MSSEADTRANYIDPKLNEAGWNSTENARIIREHYFTDGRIMGKGLRGKRKFADYALVYKNRLVGIIEAKKDGLPPTEGLEQVKSYAQALNTRFVYSTNGKEIYEFDAESGRGDYVEDFPEPATLYERVFFERNETLENINAVSFDRSAGYGPRFYQENAANAALDAIAKDKQRILLTLATGTGKTFIAFQIVWKLYKARWNRHGDGRRPRVLYLADRNILIGSQTMRDFNPLEQHCTKVNGEEIRRRGGEIPTNANVFFAIYQGIIGNTENPYYLDYPKDFFDLVVIDECHRGSANDQCLWRQVLEHFDSAVHIGMTATPKRQDNVNTYRYFGAPAYTYSLKDGINDGFLTPFKVKHVSTTMDEYRFTPDDEVLEGEVDKDVYEKTDFNFSIEIREREEKLVQILLQNIEQSHKTLIFCANQPHAALVRDLINKHKQSDNPDYCVRVTSAEGEIGRQKLADFQDNEKTIPTVLTTSQMLSTGVDARNVRNVVLMRKVGTMTEFKQIIGRGTRLFEDKDHFTIVDFYDNVRHFDDPEWDGEPEGEIEIDDTGDETTVYPGPGDEGGEVNEPQPPEYEPEPDGGVISDQEPPKQKLRIRLADGKERLIQHMVETMYFDENGKPVSPQQFLENLFGTLPEFFSDEEKLRELWSNPDTRKRLLAQLSSKGFDEDKLTALQDLIDAKDSDIYDVLRYVAFAKEALTREYRADHIDTNFYEELDEDEEVFVRFVLDKYEKSGVNELSDDNLKNLLHIKYGSSHDAVTRLGSVENVRSKYHELQKELYEVELRN